MEQEGKQLLEHIYRNPDIRWVISAHRKDKRAGKTSPFHMLRKYAEKQYLDAMRKWR